MFFVKILTIFMLTVSRVVREIIKEAPFLEEGLEREIINLSALSRLLKPQIEKRLLKEIKEGAIVMALKRMEERLKRERKKRKKILEILEIRTVNNLSLFTFSISPTIYEKIKEFQKIKFKKRETICILSEGTREITFTISSQLIKKIKENFKREKLLFKKDNLSLITLRFPRKTISIPGTYYQILKFLAWEKINLIEIFSTYTELSLLIEEKNVKRVFSIFNTLRISQP